MRALVLIAVSATILAGLIGCDDDPAGLDADQVSGRVHGVDGDAAPIGTTVYLLDNSLWIGTRLAVIDSTETGFGGWFTLDNLAEYHSYRAVAGRYSTGGPSGWSRISPFSEWFAIPVTEKIDEALDLTLNPVVTGSSATGSAMVIGEPPVPADNALVTLWRLEGPEFAIVDSTRTAVDGSWSLTCIVTGNHLIAVRKTLEGTAPELPSEYWAETPIFFVATPSAMTFEPFMLSNVHVAKPAVYIYPEAPGVFDVSLGLGRGVSLTVSEPLYDDGWSVYVDADGRIDDAYDYLFYELDMPLPEISAEGWCLDGADMESDLAFVAARCGLDTAETTAFVEYWVGGLPLSPYWLAYPVLDADLNRWATLDVSPEPDSVRRVWVFFAQTETVRDLPAPVLPPFTREGTTVIEWGGGVLPRPSV